MIGEFSFFGLYFPMLMLTALVSFLVTRAISFVIAKKGWYRHIWHPPLFDIALFFVVLGIFVIVFNRLHYYFLR